MPLRAKAGHSSQHRLFDIEEAVVLPHTRFASPLTRHLYEWWAKANGGRLPLKRQFDITEHRSIAANLVLTQVMPDGGLVFKLLGEDAIKMIGRNSTGQRVKNVGEYGHPLEQSYRSIIRDQVCKTRAGSLAFAEWTHRKFESVDCPLSSEGVAVDFIIGVMDLIE